MGRCITVITLTGATSLGLLTGSLTYQSLRAIPELIKQLNNQTSIRSTSAGSVLDAVKRNLALSSVVNFLLTTLSTSAFLTAYRYSPASGKHPYLVYSALGAPLALLALYVKAGKSACVLSGPFGFDVSRVGFKRCSKKQCSSDATKLKSAPAKAKASASEEDSLDQSYIHVSEDSSSVSSESSPETPVEECECTSSTIEEEVDDALKKKEHVNNLETVGSAYNLASSIAGVGLAVCTIGVVGDQFFL